MYMENIRGRNSCNYKNYLLSSTKNSSVTIHIFRKIFLTAGVCKRTPRGYDSKNLTYLINGLYIFNLSNHLKSKLEHQPYGCHAHAFMILLKDNTAVICILSGV